MPDGSVRHLAALYNLGTCISYRGNIPRKEIKMAYEGPHQDKEPKAKSKDKPTVAKPTVAKPKPKGK